MFGAQTYIVRRARLRSLMESGVVIIPANLDSPMSYPNNSYYFRQDSTFRYFFGINSPAYIGVIDIESGQESLYGNDPTITDLIWTGGQPLLRDMAQEVGVVHTAPMSSLKGYIAKAQRQGRQIHILPPYRGEIKLQLAQLLECSPFKLGQYISADLIFAVAQLREIKSEEEIDELERAYDIGHEMHTQAMQLTREGVSEREVTGVLRGIAHQRGAGLSFETIYTQHGEVLHNISQGGVLSSGALVLCDAGAESLAGYCSDHTRTYPVSGKFSEVQRDIYNIVLESHRHVAKIATAGMAYVDLHLQAQRVLGEGLRDFGLLRGSMDDIMSQGAVRLFMPHGTSHGLGMDVHDCEAFGERSFDFEQYRQRAQSSGTCICRDSWQLRQGAVITNEPGVYFIEALIESSRQQGLYADCVNYPLALEMCNFGGIRIEDDLIITGSEAREIGAQRPIPKSVEEIENYMSR